jgi:putative ABC transport system ATP-binding protein
VLADEPTGNLDRKHGMEALELMRAVCREHDAALLLVSHDPRVLETFERCDDLADINRAAREAGGRMRLGIMLSCGVLRQRARLR